MAITLSKLAPAVMAASKIVEDPYLPEITCYVLQLNRIERGLDPGLPCTPTVVPQKLAGKGVGMRLVVKSLRAAVWARVNPAAAFAVGLGAVGLVWYVGYSMGRQK